MPAGRGAAISTGGLAADEGASTDAAAGAMMELDETTPANGLAGGVTASTDTAAGATDLRSDGTDTMEIATDTTAGGGDRPRTAPRGGLTGNARRKLKKQQKRSQHR